MEYYLAVVHMVWRATSGNCWPTPPVTNLWPPKVCQRFPTAPSRDHVSIVVDSTAIGWISHSLWKMNHGVGGCDDIFGLSTWHVPPPPADWAGLFKATTEKRPVNYKYFFTLPAFGPFTTLRALHNFVWRHAATYPLSHSHKSWNPTCIKRDILMDGLL